MPDDDSMLAQGTVDFRDEGRRARQARSGIDLNGDILPLVFCTQDAMCGAEADGHLPDCPVELRLRDELGF